MTLAVEHIACPLCGETTRQVIHAHVDRIDTRGTQVVRCTNCGLVYLNPRLTQLADNYTLSDEYLNKCYLPDQQQRGVLTPDGQVNHRQNQSWHAQRLEQMRPYRLHNRVLDVGCAIGLFLVAARHEGWETYGVEPSPALSAHGRDGFGLDIYPGELHERAFPDDYFDVVTLWEVAEHLMHPMETLQEIQRILRPGGLVLLSTPNWHNLARDLLADRWDNFVTDHFQFFTQATMRKALQQAGLVPLQTATEGLNVQEIARKLSRRAARMAQRQMAQPQNADRGSILLAAAEKPQPPGSPSHPTVFILSGCNIGTASEYRVQHLQEQLSRLGIRSLALPYPSPRPVEIKEALACDVLYLYRVAHDSFIEQLICQARSRNIPVIFDTDDLVFEPGLADQVDSLRTMSHDEAALYYEGVWRYRRTLLACDAVVTSTGPLAELARALGKPTFVHRNALGAELVRLAEPLYAPRSVRSRSAGLVTIGYVSGTATHNKDFLQASSALAHILERHPEVELHVLGPLVTPPELARFGERVRNLELVDWTEVLPILSTFDINLAPLQRGNVFCRCKSEVKYIEAAVLGIPTVASRIDAFEYAIRDGDNGLLAGDVQEWIEKIERLLADPALGSRIGEAARADVLARYSPDVRSQELRQTLEAIRALGTERLARASALAGVANTRPLVLNWVFTEPMPGSGGHATIIQMMNLLARLGHQVNIYTVPYQRLRDKSDLEIRDYVQRHFADLEGDVFKWTGGPMGESDAVILTYWATAYMLGDTRNTSGVFYFVQDWEPFFYPMSTYYLEAEQTYRMGFSCITAGPWLTRYLRQTYGADADYFDLAVNHDIYYPRPVDRPARPRICFYARPSTPRRLVPIGIEALRLVHKRRSDVEIVFYGAADAELAGQTIRFPFRNRGILTENELAELFSSSDVGLVFSPTNCSRVPLEIMACRCAVVDLKRETVEGVLEHEVNALLAEPRPEAIAEAVLRLLDDEPLRNRLVETAYQQAQERSWEKSARQVEAILCNKLAASRRIAVEHPAAPCPNLPALADLPVGQQEHLNAIHAGRRQARALWRARVKGWIKQLFKIDVSMLVDRKLARRSGELVGARSIGQSFVARHDYLYRIDVLASTAGRRNTRDVILRLKTSPTAADDLAAVRVNGSLMRDNSYASFVFEPQPESGGKAYYLCVESPDSVSGDAIALWTFDRVSLSDARLYRNGRAGDGQLIFGVLYQHPQWGEVGERPLAHSLEPATTNWDRVLKGYRLLASQGLSGLMREVRNYLRWKASG